MATHSILAPSAAARWTRCPASVSLCMQLGDTAGRDADEGTLAHELAAALLMSPAQRCARLDSEVRPGQLPRMPDAIRADLTARGFDADAVEADVGIYVGFCSSLPGLEVERPLHLRDGMDSGYAGGTADAVADLDDGLWVADLKMGRRPVSAVGNRQLILYADAVLAEDAEKGLERPASHPVHLCIVQPRLRGSVETWQTTAAEVRQLAAEFYGRGRRAFELVRRPELVQASDFTPGAHCLYCAASGFCRALKNSALAISTVGEADGRVDRLDSAELARAWRALPMVEAWVKAVSSEVLSRLSAGVSLPGLHLEPGRPGNRRWADAEKAEAWASATFGEAAFDRSLKSVAQLEKACVKGAPPEVQDAFAALIVRPPGAMRVAEGDPPADAAPPPSACDGVFPDLSAPAAVPARDAEKSTAEDEKPKTEKASKRRQKVKKEDA